MRSPAISRSNWAKESGTNASTATIERQDFGFQPPPRLEALAQRADEKEGNCNHATIML
jgi:hypothetical protein